MDNIPNGAFTHTNSFGKERDPTFPEFKLEPVLDERATQAQGYNIFRDEERVKIHIPGNSLSAVVERVTDEHRNRWPDHYKRFKDGMQMSHEGTPLEMWPAIGSKAQVLFLKYHEIHTVEQMANVSDYNLGKLGMGGVQLRDLAKAFLDSAQRNAMTKSLMAENEKVTMELLDAKTQIAALKELMTGLQAQIEGLANRPNIMNHVPGQPDPFAGFASKPAVAAVNADPLASFASKLPAPAPAAA
jgi:hypothetical protein